MTMNDTVRRPFQLDASESVQCQAHRNWKHSGAFPKGAHRHLVLGRGAPGPWRGSGAISALPQAGPVLVEYER